MSNARWPVAVAAGLLVVVTTACDTSQRGACAGVRAADVERFFATADAGLWAADYQRAHPLGGDRTLWTFQDARVGAAGPGRHAHNAAVVQQGDCWTTLNEPDGRSWLFPDDTVEFEHWYWPLGSALTAGGTTLGLFEAELVERGDEYLDHVEPVGVALVLLDAATLAVLDVIASPAPGPENYGWSVAVDDDWAYLYGWCLRQWGWSDTGHDPGCVSEVRLARVGRDELTGSPEFWDGSGWSADPAAAVSVVDASRGEVLPLQVTRVGGRFYGVTKAGDWYGDTVYVDVADAPYGPWTATDTITVEPKCDPDDCNTYFASFTGAGTAVAISHNRWEGDGTADPVVYRPTVVPVVGDPGSPTSTTVLTAPTERG